jgi:hypothetical protein
MAKKSNAAKIREFLTANPDAKPADVAKKFKTTTAHVYAVRSNMRKIEASQWTPPLLITSSNKSIEKLIQESIQTQSAQEEDVVNHPAHYKTGGIETIDFIEAKGLNYRLGNVVKYITRADHKGERKENLLKARWYLDREIAKSV